MIPQTHIYRNVLRSENFVMSLCIRAPIRRSIFTCLALVMVCALFLLTTVNVQASTVTINDQSGVLDAGRVQAEAAKLPVPILITTTNTFTGNQDALNTSTREQVTNPVMSNPDAIAIGIDTVHRNISIEAGTNVSLSDSQASDAVSAFQSNIDTGGDYTNATIAALDSVQNALSRIHLFQFIIGLLVVVGFLVIFVIWEGEGSFRGGSSYDGGGGGGGGAGGGAGGHF